MNYRIRFVLLSLLTITSCFVSAQPKCHIEHYGLSDGLPQRTVMSILQDRKGFMWFATWGGLCKFDGYSFTSYNDLSDDEMLIKNNRIDKIKEDSYGNIWTYTAYTGEVYRFNPRSEKYITSFEIDNKPFQASEILTMPSGKVWLTSETMGTICIPDTTNTYYIFSEENSSLRNNKVNHIYEDSQLISWVLTDNGITRIQDIGEENITKENFYVSENNNGNPNSFYCSFETESEVWFGANQGRIIHVNKSSGRFEIYDTKVSSDIISIQEIFNNLLIILTSEDGFFICDKNRLGFNKFDKTRLTNLPTNEMRSCFIDSSNNIWLELGGFRVARFDLINNYLKCYEPGVSIKGDHIYAPAFSMIEDNSGRIWVHPRGGGFSYYDKTTDKLLPFFNDPISVEWKFSHILHDLYLDKQGNIWTSTRSDGVEKITFDDETFKKSDFTEGTSALNYEIRAFYEDCNGDIWLGSKEGHVAIYDSEKRFKGYLSSQGNISKSEIPLKIMAYTIMRDSRNNIWIGTKGDGAFLLEPTANHSDSYTIKKYTNNPSDLYSLNNNAVYSIHEDNQGEIWLGTMGGGINLFDKANERFLNPDNLFDSYPIHIGYEVRSINSLDHVIYVATTLGLITFTNTGNGKYFCDYQIYNKSIEGLKANDIYNIYITEQKDIYITTHEGGLSRVEEVDSLGFPIKFKTYDTKNKLASDFILSVIEDNNHRLWIISEGTISVYDLQSEQIEQFNAAIRILENNYFSEATPLLTSNGEIMIGYTKGVISFFPDNIQINDYNPYIALTQFKVSGRNYLTPGELDDVDTISLSFKENNITIAYAALDFLNPQAILYAYKLDGLENEWTYNKHQRQANFTNLPPGTYIFRVKSTNSSGIWSEDERTLHITIHPSFWQTKTAWILYILLFTVTLFIILRSIFVFFRMRDKMRMEQEQTEMRTRFFTDISHEIRTPLTLIVSPIEDILQRDKVAPEAKSQLEIVLKNTHRMLNMVNQILDFRKIQKQKLNIQEIELGRFIKDFCGNFIISTEEKNINLSVNNKIDSDKIWVDPESIEKLILNLVSNAVKHTKNGNKIEIDIFRKDKTYVLQVKDEGEGISKDIQSKLFDRFASFHTDKSKPSTGIGLSIVKEIADKHHARIVVDSQINRGTIFTVIFQTGLSHFANDNYVQIINIKEDRKEKENVPNDKSKEEEIAPDCKNQPLSILVVEDDTDLRHFIKSVLETYYKVYEASNGKEGYEAAIKLIPDFILSDIMMPGMNGIELIKEIRSNKDTSHIPFIFLTAKTSQHDELEGITLGADDYITKPFNVQILKAKIRNILTQRRLFVNQVISSGKSDERNSEEKKESNITEYDKNFLKHVTEIILSKIDNSELTIDDIVSETSISRRVFYNKIKSLTGQSPIEFVREIRMKKASELILTGEYMIKEVAYMVGFTDLKYFSRCFKQMYGVVPSEYKKK